METARHGTGISEETAVPPVASIFLEVGMTAGSRRGGMRAGLHSMSSLSTRNCEMLFSRHTKQHKLVMRRRLLSEELPLASLHEMNTVHARSLRGYCCPNAFVCTKDLSTGERAETARSHGPWARRKIQMLLPNDGSQAYYRRLTS